MRSNRLDLYCFIRIAQRFVFTYIFNQLFNTATQHNVRAAAGHIGRDRDVARLARLGHNLCLAGMLFRIEHFVTQTRFVQQAGQEL